MTDVSTPEEFMRRYPRITAHVIAHSLGYATPSKAALIGLDGKYGRDNFCEWIYEIYNKDARRALSDAIRNRHRHTGFMAEYKLARALVDRANATGKEPELASWF